MSLSNRVSVDTDVLFVRNMFVFSTNTNNVPVSTNFVMAIGSNGQMAATDALYNLSTYGVGYLPSTLSTLNGEIVSIGNLILAGGVVPAQLISVQTALESSINTLSSYVLLNVIPSTVSTFNSYISSLNSSFEGYVTATTVTGADLASTYTAATDYTDEKVSTLSNATFTEITALSNYFNVSSATVNQFSSLAGNVSAQSNYFSLQIYVLGSNFNALCTSTRLLNENNSTIIGNLDNEVSTLSNITVNISAITTPLGTLGFLSTSQCADWPFFSNIKVSSIDVRAPGTAAAPAINFTSGGDTDTGIYHPTANTLSFATAGQEKMIITTNITSFCTIVDVLDNTGNNGRIRLAANLAKPVIQLSSSNNNQYNQIDFVLPSTFFGLIQTPLAGLPGGIPGRQLVFIADDLTTAGSNVAIAIHSTGNVGIRDSGNTSNALYVNGSTFINGQLGVAAAGSAAAPALYFSEVGNDTGFFKPGDGDLAITTNGGERFRFSGTNMIGCNSDMLLYGSNLGRIEIRPNSIEPQINFYTTGAAYSPRINFSNTAVEFRTYLAGNNSVGLGTSNQLVTFAYPTGNVATSIHSTGTVGIRGFADPTFALTVNGGVRQTAPYIWSYNSPNASGLAIGAFSFTSCNIPGPISIYNTPSTINIPYSGIYTMEIGFNSQIDGPAGVSFPAITIELANVTTTTSLYTVIQHATMSGQVFNPGYFKYSASFTAGQLIQLNRLIRNGSAVNDLYWTTQYLG